MAGPEAPPSWEAVDNAFEFDLPRPQHIARGWERAPKSPHRAHQKGRKLWKRPGPRALAGQDCPSADHNGDERQALGELSNNTPRAIKKLRLKDQYAAREAKGTKASRYLATLQDISQSSPRRKQTNTGGLDFPHTQLLKPGNSNIESSDMGNTNNPVIEDTERASMRPAPLEARNTMSSPSSPTEEEASVGSQEIEFRNEKLGPEESFPAGDVRKEAQPGDAEVGMTPMIEMGEKPAQEPGSPPLGNKHLLAKKKEAASNNQHAPDTPETNAEVTKTFDVGKEAQLVSTGHLLGEGINLPHAIGTPRPRGLTPRSHQILDIFGPESPQIGTTLLRRESLRKKDSPRKGPGRPKGSSPKKQLKKRDTLQEREILQKFEESDAENKKDAEQAGDSGISFTPSVVLLPNIQPEFFDNDIVGRGESNVDDEQVVDDVDEAILQSHDVQRAVEAVEASDEVQSSTMATEQPDSVPDDDATRQAYEAIADAEVDEAQAAITAVCEKAELSVRQTRSGARFSDDTSVLKDFLSRAQARKAAQGGSLSPKVPKSLQQSPKRSPRKKNAMRPASRSSPRKARVATPRQTKFQKGSPSGKVTLPLARWEGEENDEGDDETNGEETKAADAGSCRRSTRTRLPGPVKSPAGAPSLIPVRRTDGTDPVVLQKTQAQELAITTRANTRRNKGQSRPAALALQEIPSEDGESATRSRQRAAHGKAVAWAEQLTSFQEFQEGMTEESEEQLPKVKRMRGLGKSTGTPVAKRMAGITGGSNGTPAAKRRGQMG